MKLLVILFFIIKFIEKFCIYLKGNMNSILFKYECLYKIKIM